MEDLEHTTILGGRVILHQPRHAGLRATMDSVFCAAACPAQLGEIIADFGAGTGAVGLCAAIRTGGDHVQFVEIQTPYADLCLHNASCNGITQAAAHNADIRTHKGRYDHIVCNPPYLMVGHHYQSPSAARQKALGQTDGDAQLSDWIAAAARCLKPKGSVSMIHRADALGELLSLFAVHKIGATEVWPLLPYADRPAHRVVVRGRAGRKTPMTLHAPIVIHEADGKTYTPRAREVLEEGAAL